VWPLVLRHERKTSSGDQEEHWAFLPSVLAKVKMFSMKLLYEALRPTFTKEYESKSLISLKWEEISFCSCKRRCRESPVNVKEMGEHTFYS